MTHIKRNSEILDAFSPLTLYAVFKFHNSSILAISNCFIVNINKFDDIYNIPPSTCPKSKGKYPSNYLKPLKMSLV